MNSQYPGKPTGTESYNPYQSQGFKCGQPLGLNTPQQHQGFARPPVLPSPAINGARGFQPQTVGGNSSISSNQRPLPTSAGVFPGNPAPTGGSFSPQNPFTQLGSSPCSTTFLRPNSFSSPNPNSLTSPNPNSFSSSKPNSFSAPNPNSFSAPNPNSLTSSNPFISSGSPLPNSLAKVQPSQPPKNALNPPQEFLPMILDYGTSPFPETITVNHAITYCPQSVEELRIHQMAIAKAAINSAQPKDSSDAKTNSISEFLAQRTTVQASESNLPSSDEQSALMTKSNEEDKDSKATEGLKNESELKVKYLEGNYYKESQDDLHQALKLYKDLAATYERLYEKSQKEIKSLSEANENLKNKVKELRMSNDSAELKSAEKMIELKKKNLKLKQTVADLKTKTIVEEVAISKISFNSETSEKKDDLRDENEDFKAEEISQFSRYSFFAYSPESSDLE